MKWTGSRDLSPHYSNKSSIEDRMVCGCVLPSCGGGGMGEPMEVDEEREEVES